MTPSQLPFFLFLFTELETVSKREGLTRGYLDFTLSRPHVCYRAGFFSPSGTAFCFQFLSEFPERAFFKHSALFFIFRPSSRRYPGHLAARKPGNSLQCSHEGFRSRVPPASRFVPNETAASSKIPPHQRLAPSFSSVPPACRFDLPPVLFLDSTKLIEQKRTRLLDSFFPFLVLLSSYELFPMLKDSEAPIIFNVKLPGRVKKRKPLS